MGAVGEVVPWLTPGGALLLLGLSVVRGWLVPRSTHREFIQVLEKTIDDKNATIAEQRRQLAILLGFSPELPPAAGNGSSGATPTSQGSVYGQRRRGNGRRPS